MTGIIVDQLDGGVNLLGGGAGDFRQLADFAGYNGEAAAMLANPGRLDGSIQGQQIGLAGDLVDDLDHFPDLPRRIHERLHGTVGLRYLLGDMSHLLSDPHDLALRYGNLPRRLILQLPQCHPHLFGHFLGHINILKLAADTADH
ncbi:hypothetical protein D3C71_1623780 [compost metagenome]